jgi:hypothetical protein
MKKARGFAWNSAVQLSALRGEEKQSRIDHIDKTVLKLSECIKTPRSRIVNFMLKVIKYFEENEVAKIIEGLRIQDEDLLTIS